MTIAVVISMYNHCRIPMTSYLRIYLSELHLIIYYNNQCKGDKQHLDVSYVFTNNISAMRTIQ